jgi:hypothetical protein
LTSLPSDTNSAQIHPKVNESDESRNFTNNLTFLTFAYRDNLFIELEQLVDKGKMFDGLIIDVMQTGFSLPLEALVRFSFYAQRLLNQQGVLLFVKADGAITLTKDDPGGGLTFNTYDSPFGIFTRHPMLADHLCATVSGIDRRRLQGGGNTLANHILYTSVPVLTEMGQKIKSEFSLAAPHHWVVQAIDDYTTIEVITRVMESHQHLAPDESMRIIQELESQNIIFPVFPRIQFLANCYRNRKPFRLGRYMVAANIITEAQLRELLERQSEEGWGKSQKTYLGLLAVRAGFINARELEVLLDDQYLYGGYHKKSDDRAGGHTSSIDTVRDSIIGSLGATDPAALLQSLSGGSKTGLLTVEKRDKTFIVAFQQGKPTYARLNKLKGNNALAEFLTTWSDGIFVFRDKATSQDLDSDCTLNKPLDRMLIDAAICQDHTDKILDGLPQGKGSILERVSNFDIAWKNFSQQNLKYEDDSVVVDEDKALIEKLAALIDGFSTLDEVIKSFDIWPSHKTVKAIQLLTDKRLVNIQNASLLRPLSIFQRIATELQNTIGQDENRQLLISSLQYVHGNSDAASRFVVDSVGRISLNLSHTKHSESSLSSVILELRHWMEAYLVYCKKKIPAEIVDKIMAGIVNTELSR